MHRYSWVLRWQTRSVVSNNKCWQWARLYRQRKKTRASPNRFSLQTDFPGSSTRSSKPVSQERSLGTKVEKHCSSDRSSSRGSASIRRTQFSRRRTWAASCVSWTCTGFISFSRAERSKTTKNQQSRSSTDSGTSCSFEVDSTYCTSYIATSESARWNKVAIVMRKKTHRYVRRGWWTA